MKADADSEAHPPGSPGAVRLASSLHWHAVAAHALSEQRKLDATQDWVSHDTPTERCLRHSCDASTGTWTSTGTTCKLESVSFAEGAMRQCFRLLKQTQAPHASESYAADWHHASAYVAKRYKDPEVGTLDMYRRDCVMQEEAKLYSQAWNALHPPKPVDFLQSFLLELIDRPGSPHYACERLISGAYVKHSNNSGFVAAHRRATPHAFSHFTFLHSRGTQIVVDIQGVNDLFTDPQVHTLLGNRDGGGDGGEGNLGVRGMALFFSTHRCTPLCALLDLPALPKSELELARDEVVANATASPNASSLLLASSVLGRQASSESSSSASFEGATQLARTWRSADNARVAGSAEAHEHLEAAMRAARIASWTESPGSVAACEAARAVWRARESARWVTTVPLTTLPAWSLLPASWTALQPPCDAEAAAARVRRLCVAPIARSDSSAALPRHFATGALASEDHAEMSDSQLWAAFAPVHMQLARLSAVGALPVLDDVPDEPSALFHLAYAARGGDAVAIRAMRDVCRGVVQDVVPGARLERELPEVAAALTAVLADAGDVDACVECADAAAGADDKLRWLEAALSAADARAGDAEEPVNLGLLEKLGHARAAAGDATGAAAAFQRAADAAAAAGKGKLATKLTLLAEEAAPAEKEEE